MGSGISNLYYWFAELYLDSGVVTKSKCFKVLTNIFASFIVLNIAFVSNDNLFVFQDGSESVNYNPCLLIFDKSSFIPFKKFDLDSNSKVFKTFFFANQKYYIFGVNKSTVEILTIDSSLNYASVSKVFESSRVNYFNGFLRVALFNNMFTITEAGPMYGSQKSAISNIIFHKVSLDFKSGSWEALNTDNGVIFAAGFSSSSLTTGISFINSSIASNPLNFTELNLTVVYFNSK